MTHPAGSHRRSVLHAPELLICMPHQPNDPDIHMRALNKEKETPSQTAATDLPQCPVNHGGKKTAFPEIDEIHSDA